MLLRLIRTMCSRQEGEYISIMSTPINHNADGPATAVGEEQTAMQATTLLAVSGLDTGYDETQVLWDVSLEIMRGEVIALVGANGAGKSTLLAAISGLLPAWKGSISFQGQEITHSRTERIVKLGLAHVPQGRRLFPGLTVEENLRLGAYTRRAGSAGAIADDLERVYALLPKLR